MLVEYAERVPEVYGPWEKRVEAEAWAAAWNADRTRPWRVLSLDYLRELLRPAWER